MVVRYGCRWERERLTKSWNMGHSLCGLRVKGGKGLEHLESASGKREWALGVENTLEPEGKTAVKIDSLGGSVI